MNNPVEDLRAILSHVHGRPVTNTEALAEAVTNTLALIEPERGYAITVSSRKLEELLKARVALGTAHCVRSVLEAMGARPDEVAIEVDNDAVAIHFAEMEKTVTVSPHVGLVDDDPAYN